MRCEIFFIFRNPTITKLKQLPHDTHKCVQQTPVSKQPVQSMFGKRVYHIHQICLVTDSRSFCILTTSNSLQVA
jgi:hypothetical protein